MKRTVGIAILLCLNLQVFSQDHDRPKQPDLPGDLLLDFGFNRWSEQPDLFPSKIIGSNSIGIYYNNRFRFNDHISFYPAVGFTFEKFAFDDEFTWLQDADGTVTVDSLSGIIGVRKNKLVANYFEVPVEFRIHPLGTVNGEGWFIGLGAVGGVRFGAHTKFKYDLGDDTFKEKLYSDFNLSRFRYGMQARFGFKTFHIFYKMYFSNVFDSDPYTNSGNPRLSTFGINFSGF